MTNYFINDTETGGTNAATDALLEAGAILLNDDYEEFASWSATIEPAHGLLISNEALHVQNRNFQGLLGHELDEFMALYNMNKWVEENIDIEQFGLPTYGGFNCGFDLRMMSAAYERVGLKPCYIVPERDGPMDVYKMAIRLLKVPRDVPNRKLTTLADYFGVRELNAHHTIPDCRMTAGVWRHLRRIAEAAA